MIYIQKGPYLQNPLKDAVTIRWETDKEASSEVRVYDTYMANVPVDEYPIKGEPVIYSFLYNSKCRE